MFVDLGNPSEDDGTQNTDFDDTIPNNPELVFVNNFQRTDKQICMQAVNDFQSNPSDFKVASDSDGKPYGDIKSTNADERNAGANFKWTDF